MSDETAEDRFKNFHRLLCERFGYTHDEQHWERDQLSLIEHIAAHPQIPPLDEGMTVVLGRPNFACATIAHWLRQKGHKIQTRAENEQAAVLHFTLNLYLKHGKKWAEAADEYLKP